MPADVDLFNMHRRNILENMTLDQLHQELQKTGEMLDTVVEYRNLVFKLIEDRLAKIIK